MVFYSFHISYDVLHTYVMRRKSCILRAIFRYLLRCLRIDVAGPYPHVMLAKWCWEGGLRPQRSDPSVCLSVKGTGPSPSCVRPHRATWKSFPELPWATAQPWPSAFHLICSLHQVHSAVVHLPPCALMLAWRINLMNACAVCAAGLQPSQDNSIKCDEWSFAPVRASWGCPLLPRGDSRLKRSWQSPDSGGPLRVILRLDSEKCAPQCLQPPVGWREAHIT